MSMVPDTSNQLTLRISDADRDGVIGRLRDGYAEGRLSFDEFSERIDQVLAARTTADLEVLTKDLPVTAPAMALASIGQTDIRWLHAVMNSNRQTGRWRVGPRTVATALMGTCQMDLREAQFEASEILIDALAIIGSIDVIAPEGIGWNSRASHSWGVNTLGCLTSQARQGCHGSGCGLSRSVGA